MQRLVAFCSGYNFFLTHDVIKLEYLASVISCCLLVLIEERDRPNPYTPALKRAWRTLGESQSDPGF